MPSLDAAEPEDGAGIVDDPAPVDGGDASSDLYGPGEWSEDAERESLPLTGNEERTVPDARRKVAGRSKGK